MTIINTGRTVLSKYVRKQCPNDCRCTRCQREQSANPVLTYVSTLIEHIPDPENIATEQYVDDAVSGFDISNKADKVDGAVANNFSSLDSEGNLLDSGYAPSDFADSQDLQDHINDTNNPHQVTAGQVGAAASAGAGTSGELATIDANGNAVRSGTGIVLEQDPNRPTAARNKLATGVTPNTLGIGGVDLQTYRSSSTQAAGGEYATTGGGQSNTTSGVYATTGGGQSNTTSGVGATTSGGQSNTTSGSYATTVGGVGNSTSGNYATTSGGQGNIAAGAYSIVGGLRAKNTNTSHSGVLVLSDGNNEDATSTAANQATLQYTGGIRLITATNGAGTPTKFVNIDTGGVIRFADSTARADQRTELGLGTMATANDAPSDGTQYARENGAWAAVVAGSGARTYDILVAASGGDYTTISEAVVAATPGQTIYVRNGTYAGGVTINKALTIVGESRAAVLQSPLASTACLRVEAADVVIENISIDGRRSSQSGSGSHLAFVGVLNEGGLRMTVRNCRIHSTLGNGITISSTGGGEGSKIIECSIENIATNDSSPTLSPVLVGVQIFGNASKRCQIIGNYITGWSQAVGLWYGPNECLVAGNQIINNYGYWNGVVGGTRSAVEDYGATATTHGLNIWRDNIIDGATSCCIECAQGVSGSQFLNNVCRNYNKFGDNTGGPMVIVDGGPSERTQNIIVRGNVFFGHNVAGTFTVRGLNVTIDDNRFIDLNHTAGPLVVNGFSTNLIISNNVFQNCRLAVFLDSGVSNGISIIGNRVVSPVAHAGETFDIRGGSFHNISGNVIHGTTSIRGIQINSAAGDGHRITNNTMLGMSSWCIDVRRSYCMVQGNNLQTTMVFGAIHINGTSANHNIVRWNYCDNNNQGRTVQITDNAAYNTIQENIFVGANTDVRDQTNGIMWPTNNGTISTPNTRTTFTFPVPLTGRSLGAQTIGTTQVTVAHGLPWTPREVRIRMTSAGTIWESAAADTTNIYLTADNTGRTGEVIVL